MKLSDIRTLQQVSKICGISFHTLQTRLELKNTNMIDGEDYKKLGKRLPTLLSPSGIKKIIKVGGMKMQLINSLLEKKDNIIIIGEAGCGKGIILKNMVTNLVTNDKKILLLEPLGLTEYKELTDVLDGTYITYQKDKYINFDNNLTTISFPEDLINEKGSPKIELLIDIIKDAETKGIEVVLIDEAYKYLKQCKVLFNNISVQLIANTQLDFDILSDSNAIFFSNFFKTVFLMGRAYSNLNYAFPKLLKLYNIEESYIEKLKELDRYESAIISDGKVVKNNFKITLEE